MLRVPGLIIKNSNLNTFFNELNKMFSKMLFSAPDCLKKKRKWIPLNDTYWPFINRMTLNSTAIFDNSHEKFSKIAIFVASLSKLQIASLNKFDVAVLDSKTNIAIHMNWPHCKCRFWWASAFCTIFHKNASSPWTWSMSINELRNEHMYDVDFETVFVFHDGEKLNIMNFVFTVI